MWSDAMEKYFSPFTTTNEMLYLVSSIMKKIGKLENYNDLNKMPVLRRFIWLDEK